MVGAYGGYVKGSYKRQTCGYMILCQDTTMSNRGILNQGTTISDRGILKGGQPQLSFLRFRDTMLAGAKFRAPFKAPKSAPSRPLKRNVNI
jgi:hypothetical protein